MSTIMCHFLQLCPCEISKQNSLEINHFSYKNIVLKTLIISTQKDCTYTHLGTTQTIIYNNTQDNSSMVECDTFLQSIA